MADILIEKKKKQRDPFVDILKAIGIISIVIGHSGWTLPLFGKQIPVGAFVYSYHIMIFIFVLGYLFNDKKQPHEYIGKVVLSNWISYVTYSTIFVLLHNFLLNIHIIGQTSPYSVTQTAIAIINGTLLTTGETMLSAFWFIPMYIFTAMLFCISFHLANKLPKSVIFHCLFIICFMVAGIVLNNRKVELRYHAHTSFLAVPVCYLGYICKRYARILKKIAPWWAALISGPALFHLMSLNKGVIELSQELIFSPYLFYPVTILGIYYCVSLANLIGKIKYVKQTFAYIGKNSLHIMALHFTALKLIDLLIGLIKGLDPSVYSAFPNAFDCCLLYYPVATALPLLVPFTATYIKRGCAKLYSLIMDKYKERASKALPNEDTPPVAEEIAADAVTENMPQTSENIPSPTDPPAES